MYEYEKPFQTKYNEICKYFNSPYGCERKGRCKFQHIVIQRPIPAPAQDRTVRLYSMEQLSEMELNVPRREWEIIKSKPKTSVSGNDNTITISQFNCLAQSLCYGRTDHQTFRCDPKHLTWMHRCARLLYEIVQYEPDILCVTEVDKVHFDSFFEPNLSRMGFNGIFLLKNAFHQSICDGVAIFWNTNKISYLDEKYECILGDPRTCCQVALGVRLQLKHNEVAFDVWNTHLKAGRTNESEAKRVEQCQFLMQFMRKYSYQMPVILCGDLNFHFDDIKNDEGVMVSAKAYQMLTQGVKDEEVKREDENDLVFDSLWNDKVKNTFSVYAGWKDRDVKACFDYIMLAHWRNCIKSDVFEVQQVLRGWEQKEIERFDCMLPNEIYPSDHFLIAAKLVVANQKQ